MSIIVKVFDRPSMEYPVYRVQADNEEFFIQRVETNHYPEWHEVLKVGEAWELVRFLGFTKQEAINTLL